MKTFEGEKGIGMSEREAREFLTKSRSTLLLGTTDDDGTPMIHPVWFYFDAAKTKLYFYTEPALKKAANIKARGRVYFDVDSDVWPCKGVKGKGRAKMVNGKSRALSSASNIAGKYFKKGHPMIDSVLRRVRSGGYVVFEITPAYLTSWDYGKLDKKSGKILREAVIT